MKMRDFSPSGIYPITRMDELMNKNEQIYRNLRTKLQGITKSSQCIHRNIDAIYSYSSDAEQLSRRTYEFVPIQHNLPVHALVSRIQAEEIKLQQLEAIEQELELQKARDAQQKRLIQQSLLLQREQQARREIENINEILSRNQEGQIEIPALMNYISLDSPQSLRKRERSSQNDKKKGNLKSNQVYLAALNHVPQATPDTHLQSGSISGSFSQKEEISFKSPFIPPTKYQGLNLTPNLALEYPSSYSPDQHESADQAMQASQEGKSQMFVRSLDTFQKQMTSPEEPRCFVFLPFNKLYRSPILQIIQGVVHLRRLSKTVPMERTTDKSRIVDSIKYRIKDLLLEEAAIVNQLFYDVSESTTHKVPLSTKVLIVGLTQTLKRKQHMSLLGHAFSQICNLLAQEESLERAICNISHSSLTSNSPEQKVESEIEIARESRHVGLMRIQKCIEAIYAGMNRCPQPTQKDKRLIRVSKISLFTPNELLYNIEVTCTNKLDYSFIDSLKVDKICFSLNPLSKNYDDVKRTLDLYQQYVIRHNIKQH